VPTQQLEEPGGALLQPLQRGGGLERGGAAARAALRHAARGGRLVRVQLQRQLLVHAPHLQQEVQRSRCDEQEPPRAPTRSPIKPHPRQARKYPSP
jgi:hypothetical protein